MKTVILCANPGKDRELALTRQVYAQLEAQGAAPVVCLFGEDLTPYSLPEDLRGGKLLDVIRKAQCVITFGGDGTLLHAARAAAPFDVPVLGVNLGRLGFLAELSPKEAGMIAQAALEDYTLEKRMMLDVRLLRGDETIYQDYALNDAVVGGMARIVGLRILGDGRKITEYAGDGVVLATPTGSTAYSLSAGGPIVEPEAENILITPICPHVLAARSFVLAPDRKVTVEMLRAGEKAAYLSCDGGECIPLQAGDTIQVCRSALSTSLVRLTDRRFYDKISQKLGEAK